MKRKFKHKTNSVVLFKISKASQRVLNTGQCATKGFFYDWQISRFIYQKYTIQYNVNCKRKSFISYFIRFTQAKSDSIFFISFSFRWRPGTMKKLKRYIIIIMLLIKSFASTKWKCGYWNIPVTTNVASEEILKDTANIKEYITKSSCLKITTANIN